MAFHLGAVLFLLAVGAMGVWQLSLAQPGLTFLLYMLLALAAVILVPLLLYRVYGLQAARYTLEPDGIHLRWGLRSEDIPMNRVLWAGAAESLGFSLPRPFLRWPGSVLGTRQLPDGRPVEFLAARATGLVLILTPERAFAISPADRNGFLTAFKRLAEFGALAPIPARSVFPVVLLSRSWSDRLARGLLVASILLSLALFAWVALAIPGHPQIQLHLEAENTAPEWVPGVRLLLLPILNSVVFVADLVLGLFLYRRSNTQPLTYLLWGSSALTSILFLGAVYFILQAA